MIGLELDDKADDSSEWLSDSSDDVPLIIVRELPPLSQPSKAGGISIKTARTTGPGKELPIPQDYVPMFPGASEEPVLNEAVYTFDVDSLPEKPWTKPGEDISDYFNYSFTEQTWKLYCQIQNGRRQAAQLKPPLPSGPAEVHEALVGVRDPSTDEFGRMDDLTRGSPHTMPPTKPKPKVTVTNIKTQKTTQLQPPPAPVPINPQAIPPPSPDRSQEDGFKPPTPDVRAPPTPMVAINPSNPPQPQHVSRRPPPPPPQPVPRKHILDPSMPTLSREDFERMKQQRGGRGQGKGGRGIQLHPQVGMPHHHHHHQPIPMTGPPPGNMGTPPPAPYTPPAVMGNPLPPPDVPPPMTTQHHHHHHQHQHQGGGGVPTPPLPAVDTPPPLPPAPAPAPVVKREEESQPLPPPPDPTSGGGGGGIPPQPQQQFAIGTIEETHANTPTTATTGASSPKPSHTIRRTPHSHTDHRSPTPPSSTRSSRRHHRSEHERERKDREPRDRRRKDRAGSSERDSHHKRRRRSGDQEKEKREKDRKRRHAKAEEGNPSSDEGGKDGETEVVLAGLGADM